MLGVMSPRSVIASIVVVVTSAIAGAQEPSESPMHREVHVVTDFESGDLPSPDRGNVAWIDDTPDGARALRWTLRRTRTSYGKLVLANPEPDLSRCGALAFSIRTDRDVPSGRVVVSIVQSSSQRLFFNMPALSGGAWHRFGLPVNAFDHVGAIDHDALGHVWFEVKPVDDTTIDIDRVSFLAGGIRWWRPRPEPLDFEDPLRLPHIASDEGAVSVERERDGEGHFARWRTDPADKDACHLYIRPVPIRAENHGLLTFRLRASSPLRGGVRLWIGNHKAEFMYLDLASPGRAWTDYRIPLAFASRWGNTYAHDSTTFISFTVQPSGPDFVLDVDDVAWTGRRGWNPIRSATTTFDRPGDVESAFAGSGGVERVRRAGEWGLQWTATGDRQAELRLRCAPVDLRRYNALSLRIWSGAPVPPHRLAIALREDPQLDYGPLGDISDRLPGLERGWNTVRIALDGMQADPYATLAHVDEIAIRDGSIRDTSPRTLVLGGVTCIEGTRKDTRWTRAIDHRIRQEVRRGDDGEEAVRRALHTFRGSDGVEIRLTVVQALRALGPVAAPRLVSLVVDPAPAVQVRASFALQHWGLRVKSVVPALVDAIGANDGDVAHEVFHVLLALGPTGEQALADLAGAESDDVRAGVQHAIQNANEPPQALLDEIANRFRRTRDDARARRLATVLAGVGEAGRTALREALGSVPSARRVLGLQTLGTDLSRKELVATLDDLPPAERVALALQLLTPERGRGMRLEMQRLRRLAAAGQIPRHFLDELLGRDDASDPADDTRPRALAVVIAALEGDAPDLRMPVLEAIRRSPSLCEDLMPSVLRGFSGYTPQEQRAALKAARRIDAPEPELAPLFEGAFASDDRAIRTDAARALANNVRLALLFPDFVARGIADPDPGVRRQALRAAAGIRRPSSEVERALESLLTGDAKVSHACRAAVALRWIARHESSVPALARFRATTDYRTFVAEAEKACRERLAEAGNAGGHARALETLVNTIGRDAVPLLCSLLDDDRSDVVDGALQRLATLRDPSALDAIRAHRDHPSAERRWAVLAALVLLAPDGGSADIRRAIAKAEPDELLQIFSMLSLTYVPGIGSTIAETLDKGDFRIRVAALGALSTNGGPEQVPAILRLLTRLSDGAAAASQVNAYVRMAAMQAIGRLDPEGHADRMRALLRRDAAASQMGFADQMFADALARIQDPATEALLVESGRWFPLNWYTAPATMRRLHDARIDAAAYANVRWAELLPHIAEAVDVAFQSDVPIRGWSDGAALLVGGPTMTMASTGRSRTALELLDAYASLADHVVLVSDDTIRIVDLATGARHWRDRTRRR